MTQPSSLHSHSHLVVYHLIPHIATLLYHPNQSWTNSRQLQPSFTNQPLAAVAITVCKLHLGYLAGSHMKSSLYTGTLTRCNDYRPS